MNPTLISSNVYKSFFSHSFFFLQLGEKADRMAAGCVFFHLVSSWRQNCAFFSSCKINACCKLFRDNLILSFWLSSELKGAVLYAEATLSQHSQ